MTRSGWILLALAGVVASVAVLTFLLGRPGASPPPADPQAAPAAPAAPANAASGGGRNGRVQSPQGEILTAQPERVGQCVASRVAWVGYRLEGGDGQPIPDSGSAIRLGNGVYGVSYDKVPAVDASRVGDRVRTCLVSIPPDCPPGDKRGREYRTVNLRTGQQWTLPDSQHMCGGA
jgi:hypothetical protein